MNKLVKKVIVSTVALSMIVPALGAPEAQAAKKPSLPKSVSVKAGATKKVSVKGIKAKKIKKTTWSVKSKKIATLSKKKKNSVTIKGKKKGTTKLTAKIKVGKKTYKKTCKISVKAAAVKKTPTPEVKKDTITPTPGVNATAVPSSAPATTPPTPAPTLRPLKKDYTTVEGPAALEPDAFPTPIPTVKIDEATKVGFKSDFEDIAIGTKKTCLSNVPEDDPDYDAEGMGGAYLRGHGEDADKTTGTSKDYLEVIDGSEVPIDGNTNNSHVLYCHSEVKHWQGPMFPLAKHLDPGCTYKLEADIASKDVDLMGSWQLQTIEELKESYGNIGPNNTKTKYFHGKWNHVELTISVPDDCYYYAVYFEAHVDNKKPSDIYLDNLKLTKTMQTNPDTNIPSLKETYKDVFNIVGVGAGISSILGDRGSDFIANQYNAYTPGNEMKPDAILGSTPGKIVTPDTEDEDNTDFFTLEDAKAQGYYIPDDYASYEDNKLNGQVVVPRLKFKQVDLMLAACAAKGLKLRGHTLLWHQQTPVFFFQKSYKGTRNSSAKNYNVSKECMNSRLEFYTKTVMSHIFENENGSVLYGFDVVNEYLHSTNEEKGKPTYWDEIYGTKVGKEPGNSTGVTLRPEFVKAAFKYTHEMLVKYNRTDVKLFYNDFNCYDIPEEIVHLVDYINEDGIICDGVGLQSHLSATDPYPSAQKYAQLLECLRLNLDPKLEIQITELDAGIDSSKVTDQQHAVYYDQIMNAILTSKKKGNNITGIVIWSLYDAVSWRDASRPCLFSGLYMVKPAFYGVLGAKERYWSDK